MAVARLDIVLKRVVQFVLIGVGNAERPRRPPWVAITASKSALKTRCRSNYCCFFITIIGNRVIFIILFTYEYFSIYMR